MNANRLLGVTAVLASSGMGNAAQAAEWVVPSNGLPDVATAIALSEPGDVITVAGPHGSESAAVHVPHSLTLRGLSTPVTIGALSAEPGVSLTLFDVEVGGTAATHGCTALCLTGGSLAGSRLRVTGGGVAFDDVFVALDDATFDVPITASDSTLTLTRSTHDVPDGAAITGVDTTLVLYDVWMDGGGLDLTGGRLDVWSGQFEGAVGPAISLSELGGTLAQARQDGLVPTMNAVEITDGDHTAPRLGLQVMKTSNQLHSTLLVHKVADYTHSTPCTTGVKAPVGQSRADGIPAAATCRSR